MKKILPSILITILYLSPTLAVADGWTIISDAISKLYGVNLNIKDLNASQLETLVNIQKSFTGRHEYGNNYYDRDLYAWGGSSNTWQDVLSLAQHGSGDGQLGETISSLAREYPIQSNFNSPNQDEKHYYRLQAQTALASRSAAEVSYQQAVREEKIMRSLHDLIDKVEDEKSASDLHNRLASEQGMTSVQQLKLLSILVQQNAVSAQEKANRAKEDMEFFDIK